jgi:hypothetical protein
VTSESISRVPRQRWSLCESETDRASEPPPRPFALAPAQPGRRERKGVARVDGKRARLTQVRIRHRADSRAQAGNAFPEVKASVVLFMVVRWRWLSLPGVRDNWPGTISQLQLYLCNWQGPVCLQERKAHASVGQAHADRERGSLR